MTTAISCVFWKCQTSSLKQHISKYFVYLKEFEICCDRLEKQNKTIDESYTRHREEATKSEKIKKFLYSSKNRSRKSTQYKNLPIWSIIIFALHRRRVYYKLNLLIVHPTKRDGGIMNCFLTADTDELIVGQEAVLENCLHTLEKISGEAEQV